MSDLIVDLSSLSEDIREKLAELDLELSEGKFYQIVLHFKNIITNCLYYNKSFIQNVCLSISHFMKSKM